MMSFTVSSVAECVPWGKSALRQSASERWCLQRQTAGPLAGPGRRPSIYGCRCRHPPAVYPRTRAGPPSAYARPGPEGSGLLDLAPGGVCLADPVARAAGGLLHHRFTLTAGPVETVPAAVCSLWHFPAGHPGWVLPTTLPCGVRTFLDAPDMRCTAAARPAHPRWPAYAKANRTVLVARSASTSVTVTS